MPPDTWPLVGRDDELAAASEALAGEATSIVISGSAGVGKTRVAEELLKQLAATGVHVLRMMATRAAATIPFGAAAPVLGDDTDAGSTAESESASLNTAREAILRRAGGRALVLGVDDAHLLDDATAHLVSLLAGEPKARVVLTLRRTEPAPRPIDVLRDHGRCRQLELQPLGRDDVAELLESVLGGQVERLSADDLWRVSAGNALYLRELCRDALLRGALQRHHGVWAWTRGPVLSTRLQELLDARVGELPEAEREAAALLALGEPLPRSLLVQLAPPGAVDRLMQRGLASEDPVGGTGREPTVRLSHPLYGEGLRSRFGPLETSDLYARLAEGLGARGAATSGDRLRVAVWSVTSGRAVDTGLLVAAARDALARGDEALAERLARAAAADRQGALVLGEALAALRRGAEAEAVLAPLEAHARSTPTRVAVCVARLAAHRSPVLPLAAARRLAHDALTALDHDDDDRDLIDAALADTLCDRGRVAEAGAMALPLLASANSAARAIALGPASTWLVSGGRSEEAVRAGRAALADALEHRHDLAWAPGIVVGHLGTALLSTGRLDELAQLCERAKAGPLAPTGRSRGVVALLEGSEALVRGRPQHARSVLREAVLSFERADGVGRRARALALLAEAEALLGDIDSATSTLAAMPAGATRASDYDRQRAELCVDAARGEERAAARHSLELADAARQVGAPFFELAMAYTAMRFGSVETAGRVAAVAATVQGGIAAAFGEHGAALASHDASKLERAAGTLARMGCRLLAAEAMVHAAQAHQRAGRPVLARAAASRAVELRDCCEGARTPLLTQGAIVADLTRREREVASLAAAGMTSREISDRLGVSVRTVDNQLGRVYTKLGIGGRGELPRYFGA
ncbi:MAG: AAA family ATPase [Acidimicrobiales bacterium]